MLEIHYIVYRANLKDICVNQNSHLRFRKIYLMHLILIGAIKYDYLYERGCGFQATFNIIACFYRHQATYTRNKKGIPALSGYLKNHPTVQLKRSTSTSYVIRKVNRLQRCMI